MSGGVTTNYGLKKPNFNARPWDSDVNSNWDLIDAILYTLTQIPNIGGVWRNSTQYNAGQNVLDAQSLTFYQCVVSNVSAATGLFAADRAANPANWTVTTAGQGAVRYDQGQVLSSGQQAQARTNIGAINQAVIDALTYLRYDSAQTLTYQQILQVLNNLLIDGTESILTAAATTDIGNAGSQNVRIDGTTTIISFGARPNKYKLLRFTGSLTLTNSASLVLPRGQNIQTQAGDTCIATSDANNNWYVRAYQRIAGPLLQAPINSAAAATATATEADSIVRLGGSTAYTRTLPTLASVFFGYQTGVYKNNGTAIVTVAAATGDNLEGSPAGTVLLLPKQRAYFYADTDGWHVDWTDRTPILGSRSFSTPAVSADFALPSGYVGAEYILTNIVVDTANAILGLRTSVDGGTTFAAGSSDYFVDGFYASDGSSTMGTQSAQSSSIILLDGIQANSVVPVMVRGFIGVGSATVRPGFLHNAYGQQTSSGITRQLSGRREAAAVINALRFFVSSGNIIAGSISLRGIVG